MSITAKSVIFDIADGYGGLTYLRLRAIAFFFGGNRILLPLPGTDFDSYATSEYSASYPIEYAFDSDTIVTGTGVSNCWLSGSDQLTNQRIIVVFNSSQTFDEIKIVNSHYSGTQTDRGLKNVKITSSTDIITDTTYNATVSNSTLLNDTVWPEHSAIDEADWQLVYTTLGLVSSVVQPYSLPATIVSANVEQPYDFYIYLIKILEQLYSFRIQLAFTQFYGDVPTTKNKLNQYYSDAATPMNTLSQLYEDALLSRNTLKQIYILTKTTINKLAQTYGISAHVLHAINEAVYNIELNNQVKASTVLPYNIFNDSVLLTLSTSVTIGNSIIDVDSLDISFSQSEYCGSCDLTLTDEQAFLSAEYLDDIQIVVQGEVFDFILISKSDSNSIASKTYSIQGKSKAVLLDFPYATEILDDSLVVGKSSEIVNSLANLYSQNITWNIPADSILTQIDFQTTGKSPLQAIKEIVNSFGGVVQSLPNGDLVALPNYQVDTDKYTNASLNTTFDVGIDCTTVSTSDVKMSGFNRFSVANSTLNDKYTLQTVSISSTVYEVRAFKVPWSSIQPILTTSELTNVSITSKNNYVSEELTETIEIINGAGKLKNSFYDLLNYNYGSRINLGTPTIKEDGQITTAISENSMLTITYVTRFWSWEVKDTDIEDVQFILLTDES